MPAIRADRRRPRRLGGLLGAVRTGALIAIAVPSAATSVPAQETGPRRGIVVVDDVSVVPMDAERVLPHRTVVVQDGVVTAVGPAGEVGIPEDALRIDGRGLWLMPGLADMHVHLFEVTDLLLYLANGVTTIRNLGGYGAADSVLALRARVGSGELLGPTILTSGNWLDGDPPVRDINTVVTSPEAARDEVSRQARAGYDFVKVYNNLAGPVYRAILEEARRRGLPVTGHIPGSVGLEGLGPDQVEIAHAGPILRAVGWNADPAAVAHVARRLASSGITVTATLSMSELGIHQAGDGAEVERVAAREENRYVPPSRRAFWRDENMFAGLPRNADPEARLAALRAFVGVLHREGVRILAGTDADVGGQIPGFSIHDELRNLVAAGLTPYQALRTATADAHAFLSEVLPDVQPFGTVGVGLRADLLLLGGDPLEDVANVRRRVGVMVRGRWLPEAELQAMLEEIAASYRD